MKNGVEVTYLGGDRFEIGVRQHRLQVDQPVQDGGEDSAPTPTELFVSGLVSCVAFYVRRFLHRHHLPADGLAVHAEFTMAGRPARVGEVVMHVELPAGIPEEQRAPLLAVASHCTVHNTLVVPPEIVIGLDVEPSAAA